MRICFALLVAWVASPLVTVHAGWSFDSGLMEDHYIGADDHGYGDVIGGDKFKIHESGVDLTNSGITFTIKTNFVKNPDALGTEYGDLFFTFGGYTPYTDDDLEGGLSSPIYGLGDDSVTGTKWTHAIQLQGDLSSDDGLAGLYSIDTGDYEDAVKLSNHFEDDFPNNAIYRGGQEVRVDTEYSGNQELTSGSGSWARNVQAKTLTISLDVDTQDVFGIIPGEEQTIAWHWTMTCGNDTVEDIFSFTPPDDPSLPPPPNSVPEPHSLAIFAFGAFGAFGLAGTAYRNRRRAKA